MSIEAGQQILHYRLIEQIGEGGMGVVWKAEDTRLHRHVALKFVPEGSVQDSQAVDRHLREARAASALNHPHICSIHDIGEVPSASSTSSGQASSGQEGRRFIVMELLEGRSLRQQIDDKPLQVETAIDLAIQLADALDAAHGKGIIHRDIKPANIFVVGEASTSPRAKMLDFGLAKLTAGPDHDPGADEATRTALETTTPGTVMGTVSYMSPEQALGKELDQRTDIFSLGVVLYEMITARRAFEGNTSAAVFDAILNREPKAPVDVNAKVPTELERIVNKALEKDPELRYQSAAELRADLRRLQRDSSSGQLAAMEPRRAAVSSSRPLRIVGVVVAVLVLSIVGFVYWQSANHDAPPGSTDADIAPSRGPRVAVLPFVNASGDPDQDYFAHGLTEDIITELSKLQSLSVIAHRATFEYKGKSVGARQVGTDLGVRYVLEGSVRRAGDRIRVNAQLSDAGDGIRLWADSFERDSTVTDLFSLQDELTQQVVNAIAGSYGALSRAEIAEARRKPPASLDSYDCVLRAYEYLQVHTEENHFAARDCLEKVVERDPDYTDAWAWLAYLYGEEFHHQWNPRPESYDALDRSLEVAERAVRLDQTSQVAHAMLGTTYRLRHEFERFRVEADRAIAINPNNALWLGLLGSGLTQVGDWERGIPLAKRAFELNPNPPPWIYMSFFLDHYRNRRYEEALAEAQRAETEDYRAHVFRAAVYGQLGRADEAKRELSELREQFPGTSDELRQALLEQYGFPAEVADHLFEGLEKAGLEID